MRGEERREAVREALEWWTQAGTPDDFRMNTEDGIHASILFHERHPGGGTVYTLELRPVEGSPELIARMRVAVPAPGAAPELL